MFQKIEYKTILLIIAAIIIVFACLNIYQKLTIRMPDDGIVWEESEKGYPVVKDVAKQGLKGQILKKDILLAIDNSAIRSKLELTKIIAMHKPGDMVNYTIKRDNSVMQVQLTISKKQTFFYSYLCVVGFSVIAFGIFILIKGKNEALSRAFFYTALSLFSVYTYSHIGIFNIIDWMYYWIDEIALLILPVAFIHLCFLLGGKSLNPERAYIYTRKFLLLPGVLISAKILLFLSKIIGIMQVGRNYERIYQLLERAELGYFLTGIVAGIILLVLALIRTENAMQKNQLKLVLAGIGAGFGLFILFGIPHLLFGFPMKALEISTLTQIFIPISFTYSLLKYRLMDVDIIIKRGIIYTITTGLIICVYVGAMLASLHIFGKGSSASLLVSATLSTILAFLVFSPLRQRIMQFINRKYYKESYDIREKLRRLLKSISKEPDIMRLSKELVPMIAFTFQVNKIVLYIKHNNNFEILGRTDLGENNKESVLLSNELVNHFESHFRIELSESKSIPYQDELSYFSEIGMRYLFPCVYQKKVNGLLALNCKSNDELLTSEDEDLLIEIASNLATAIEISRLVVELSQKAQELEKLKNFNENLLASVNVGIVSITHEKEISWCNDCFLEIIGLSRTEVVSKALDQVFPRRFLRNVFDYFSSLDTHNGTSNNRQFYKTILELNDKNLRVNVSLVDLKSDQDDNKSNILIIEDITAQARMEEQLIHAEKLSSIGLMAAGVAHEVNTPLTGIASYTQILQKETKDKKSFTILNKIQEQAFRASKIVSNLLNLTRRQGVPMTIIDLHYIINESINLLQPHFKGTGIKIKREFSNEEYFIKGSEAKLQQLITNLLMNAKDAMPQGGIITIKTWAEDDYSYFSIADEGMGIDPTIQDKIFDPFFTTKAPSKGTGLGLSLSYSIVQEHSGAISFKSQPGKGTVFMVSFPMERVKDEQQRAFINS